VSYKRHFNISPGQRSELNLFPTSRKTDGDGRFFLTPQQLELKKSLQMKMQKRFLSAFFVAALLTWNAHAVEVNITTTPADTGTHLDFSGTTPIGSFTSPDIQFLTNTGQNWHPFGQSAFGTDITGTLLIAAPGTHTFNLASDDGSYLFIDGNLVVNNGGVHGPSSVSNSALLTAGDHPFEVQFWENGVGQSGVDLNLPQAVTFVPEPATWTLLLLGLTATFGLVLRRKRA
jgi:hypothetical protein